MEVTDAPTPIPCPLEGRGGALQEGTHILIILYPFPRSLFLLHKRQAWHNCVSVPLCTRDNCASVYMATQSCLPA